MGVYTDRAKALKTEIESRKNETQDIISSLTSVANNLNTQIENVSLNQANEYYSKASSELNKTMATEEFYHDEYGNYYTPDQIDTRIDEWWANYKADNKMPILPRAQQKIEGSISSGLNNAKATAYGKAYTYSQNQILGMVERDLTKILTDEVPDFTAFTDTLSEDDIAGFTDEELGWWTSIMNGDMDSQVASKNLQASLRLKGSGISLAKRNELMAGFMESSAKNVFMNTARDMYADVINGVITADAYYSQIDTLLNNSEVPGLGRMLSAEEAASWLSSVRQVTGGMSKTLIEQNDEKFSSDVLPELAAYTSSYGLMTTEYLTGLMDKHGINMSFLSSGIKTQLTNAAKHNDSVQEFFGLVDRIDAIKDPSEKARLEKELVRENQDNPVMADLYKAFKSTTDPYDGTFLSHTKETIISSKGRFYSGTAPASVAVGLDTTPSSYADEEASSALQAAYSAAQIEYNNGNIEAGVQIKLKALEDNFNKQVEELKKTDPNLESESYKDLKADYDSKKINIENEGKLLSQQNLNTLREQATAAATDAAKQQAQNNFDAGLYDKGKQILMDDLNTRMDAELSGYKEGTDAYNAIVEKYASEEEMISSYVEGLENSKLRSLEDVFKAKVEANANAEFYRLLEEGKYDEAETYIHGYFDDKYEEDSKNSTDSEKSVLNETLAADKEGASAIVKTYKDKALKETEKLAFEAATSLSDANTQILLNSHDYDGALTEALANNETRRKEALEGVTDEEAIKNINKTYDLYADEITLKVEEEERLYLESLREGSLALLDESANEKVKLYLQLGDRKSAELAFSSNLNTQMNAKLEKAKTEEEKKIIREDYAQKEKDFKEMLDLEEKIEAKGIKENLEKNLSNTLSEEAKTEASLYIQKGQWEDALETLNNDALRVYNEAIDGNPANQEELFAIYESAVRQNEIAVESEKGKADKKNQETLNGLMNDVARQDFMNAINSKDTEGALTIANNAINAYYDPLLEGLDVESSEYISLTAQKEAALKLAKSTVQGYEDKYNEELEKAKNITASKINELVYDADTETIGQKIKAAEAAGEWDTVTKLEHQLIDNYVEVRIAELKMMEQEIPGSVSLTDYDIVYATAEVMKEGKDIEIAGKREAWEQKQAEEAEEEFWTGLKQGDMDMIFPFIAYSSAKTSGSKSLVANGYLGQCTANLRQIYDSSMKPNEYLTTLSGEEYDSYVSFLVAHPDITGNELSNIYQLCGTLGIPVDSISLDEDFTVEGALIQVADIVAETYEDTLVNHGKNIAYNGRTIATCFSEYSSAFESDFVQVSKGFAAPSSEENQINSANWAHEFEWDWHLGTYTAAEMQIMLEANKGSLLESDYNALKSLTESESSHGKLSGSGLDFKTVVKDTVTQLGIVPSGKEADSMLYNYILYSPDVLNFIAGIEITPQTNFDQLTKEFSGLIKEKYARLGPTIISVSEIKNKRGDFEEFKDVYDGGFLKDYRKFIANNDNNLDALIGDVVTGSISEGLMDGNPLLKEMYLNGISASQSGYKYNDEDFMNLALCMSYGFLTNEVIEYDPASDKETKENAMKIVSEGYENLDSVTKGQLYYLTGYVGNMFKDKYATENKFDIVTEQGYGNSFTVETGNTVYRKHNGQTIVEVTNSDGSVETHNLKSADEGNFGSIGRIIAKAAKPPEDPTFQIPGRDYNPTIQEVARNITDFQESKATIEAISNTDTLVAYHKRNRHGFGTVLVQRVKKDGSENHLLAADVFEYGESTLLQGLNRAYYTDLGQAMGRKDELSSSREFKEFAKEVESAFSNVGVMLVMSEGRETSWGIHYDFSIEYYIKDETAPLGKNEKASYEQR